MADEKRPIDANKLMKELSSLTMTITGLRNGTGVLKKCLTQFRNAVLRIVDEQPTMDAVEVVRCKDCLYRSQYSDENGMYHCGGIDTTENHVLPVVSPDFFCAHGERRTTDDS